MPSYFSKYFDVAGKSASGSSVTANAMAALDVDKAIASHLYLKTQLRKQLDAGLDGRDTLRLAQEHMGCRELAIWMLGQGLSQLGHQPRFVALRAHHKTFHLLIADTVTLATAGKISEAKRMLDESGEVALMLLISSLITLRAAAARHADLYDDERLQVIAPKPSV